MKIYNISTTYTNRLLIEKIDGGRILDIGGAFCPQRIKFLAENLENAEFFMLDIADPVQPLGEKISFLKMPLEEATPSKIGKFRHILLSNVLEHLESPGLALKICASLLEKNGTVHILSPNCESLNRRIGLIMGKLSSIREIPDKEKEIGHLHAMTVQDIIGYIADSGLVLKEHFGTLLKPVPTPEMIEWPPERIDAFFKIAPTLPPDLCHEVYFRAGKTCS